MDQERNVNKVVQINHQRGFTFTEVLVAMLVLGISVMAFAGLQVRALQTTGVSHSRSVAMSLAGDMVERIRANPTALATYRTTSLYSSAAPTTPPASWGSSSCILTNTSGVGCSDVQMATFDINELKYQTAQMLPQGGIRVASCAGAANLSCAFIFWGGTTSAQCTANDAVNGNCVAMEVMAQ